jgi:hypothetical protein
MRGRPGRPPKFLSTDAPPPGAAGPRVDDADAFAFDTTGFLYENDPGGFVIDCFDWSRMRGDDRPTIYQLDALEAMVSDGRFAMRGPHGLGKTAWAAWLILWFALTREALGRDWKIPTTAGSWLQLKKFLWPEVHKWSRLVRWPIVGRPPLVDGRELLDLSIKLPHGEAFAVPSNQPSRVEGAHADSMLFLFDESKAIPDQMFDAAEGAFSGAGRDTGREALAAAISTPGEPQGRFYDIHSRKRGYEQWRVRHVTSVEAIAAGRMSEDWRAARERQWGRESAIYQNRVEGNFATSGTDAVIPLTWVEMANERWQEYVDAHGRPSLSVDRPDASFADKKKPRSLTAIGGDVSYGGADKSLLAFREQWVIWQIDHIHVEAAKNPNAQIAGRIQTMHRLFGGTPVVDVVGWGAGCVEQLRMFDPPVPVIPFSAGSRAERPDGTIIMDATGEIGFADLRSACWWYLRWLLNPESPNPIMLPPDSTLPEAIRDEISLIGDLTAPKWTYSSGKIKVESKKDIRERLQRSTDCGDVVVQAFAFDYLRDLAGLGTMIQIGVSGESKWRAAR